MKLQGKAELLTPDLSLASLAFKVSGWRLRTVRHNKQLKEEGRLHELIL